MNAEAKPPAQSSYRVEIKIPPTFVTKDLLKSIEGYLLKRAEAVPPPNAEYADINFQVAIVDAFGTETLGTIDAFGPSRFLDSTSKIRMKLAVLCKPKRHLSVTITFHRFRFLSDIDIDFTGPSPREFARGLVDGMMNFLSTSPARTGWAYPSELISGFSLGMVVMLGWLSIAFWRYATVQIVVPYVCLFLVALWFAGLGKSMVPYCVIDTSANERWLKTWDWLGKTLLGFLLVGVLLATLKDKIFQALGL
jgi:hypothetical protein